MWELRRNININELLSTIFCDFSVDKSLFYAQLVNKHYDNRKAASFSR